VGRWESDNGGTDLLVADYFAVLAGVATDNLMGWGRRSIGTAH